MSPIEFTSVVPGVSASAAIPGVAAGVLALSSALLLKFARNILVTKRATAARKKKTPHHLFHNYKTREHPQKQNKEKANPLCSDKACIKRHAEQRPQRFHADFEEPGRKKSVIGCLETMTRTMNLSRKKNVGKEYESVRQSVSQSVSQTQIQTTQKRTQKEAFFSPRPIKSASS